MSPRSEWIDTAWHMVLEREFSEAKQLLQAIIEEKDSPVKLRQTVEQRWAEVADAQECLAAIAYVTGDYREVVKQTLQSITRTDAFRVGAYLLAAKAHARLGEKELAISKLRVVVARSHDMGVAAIALADIAELAEQRET
jgi:hypothetical protein